jgi:hypothetical protein
MPRKHIRVELDDVEDHLYKIREDMTGQAVTIRTESGDDVQGLREWAHKRNEFFATASLLDSMQNYPGDDVEAKYGGRSEGDQWHKVEDLRQDSTNSGSVCAPDFRSTAYYDSTSYAVSKPMPSMSAPIDRSRPPVGTR